MNERNVSCPKCSGDMEEGFIAEQYGGHMIQPSEWIEGAPVTSFWRGTKINDKKQYFIRTLRCVGCGYLESYATKEKQNDI